MCFAAGPKAETIARAASSGVLTASGAGADDQREDCVVCMADGKTHLLAPCGHVCVCGNCSQVLLMQYANCPICRTPISAAYKVFNV